MPQIPPQRTLNVAQIFNNCFFHAYAMYLLANKLPLPADLFTFSSLLGVESCASHLQRLFADQNPHALFAKYEQLQQGERRARGHFFLFEETLIIGLLLREWFAFQLAKNESIGQRMVEGPDGIITKFTNYIEFRAETGPVELLSGREGVIYTASLDFLEYCFSREHGDHLTQNEQGKRFESYFTNAVGNPSMAYQAYWLAEGYLAYCRLLAQPGVMVSPYDVSPVLEMLGQPIEVWDISGILSYSQGGRVSSRAPFKILFEPRAEHYHLAVTTGTMEDRCIRYAQRRNLYRRHSREALDMPSGEDPSIVEALPLVQIFSSASTSPHAPTEAFIEVLQRMHDRVGPFIDSPLSSSSIYLPDELEENFAGSNVSFLLETLITVSALMSVIGLFIFTLGLLSIITLPPLGQAAALGCTAATTWISFSLFNRGQKSQPSLLDERTFPQQSAVAI